MRWFNLALKVAFLGLLAFAATHQELSRFAGKAMDVRLWVFGPVTLIVPVAWLVAGHRRFGRAYPYWIDMLLVFPFLIDAIGNALDLYDSVTWFDDVMHLATWLPLVLSFGLALHYAPAVPRWAHAGLVVAFGAVTHILWEEGEYLAFIRDNPKEFHTAYTDTLGDLAMSLAGTVIGAVLTVTVLWGVGQRIRAGS